MEHSYVSAILVFCHGEKLFMTSYPLRKRTMNRIYSSIHPSFINAPTLFMRKIWLSVIQTGFQILLSHERRFQHS